MCTFHGMNMYLCRGVRTCAGCSTGMDGRVCSAPKGGRLLAAKRPDALRTSKQVYPSLLMQSNKWIEGLFSFLPCILLSSAFLTFPPPSLALKLPNQTRPSLEERERSLLSPPFLYSFDNLPLASQPNLSPNFLVFPLFLFFLSFIHFFLPFLEEPTRSGGKGKGGRRDSTRAAMLA
ncbi:hypothetical protein IE53DRAFT_144409 [Violaceomyces palustris]|uniref:Uncharacterized protein n=1 Tax=Violaceomyces palustris TaxID=1673888 RepID=A0ACD0NUF2_9BASI|nr:hypothetical protein IE53DRAFT_144409 [Violaceomyces palustris]